jgi:anion-transporting  ArsA/GET3 family ATPase
MIGGLLDGRLIVVVGAGGVGKTTLAAALALCSARQGQRTLVMTFDPSLRLKDALGVGEAAKDEPVPVAVETGGGLDAALLDAKRTFDRLIQTYAPDAAAAERIFSNRFYRDLAGNLSGILEYMAMERLFEVQASAQYDRIILDTPPTRQAMDFLQAPDRMMNLVDSKAVRFALDPWWDGEGHKSLAFRIAAKGAQELADRVIGHRFLLDVVEFIRAFAPLFDGFRARAEDVRELLRSADTRFLLVAGPGRDRVPDAMFFLRKLKEAGHHLGPVLVNQVHPDPGPIESEEDAQGHALLRFLAERDSRGLDLLRSLFPGGEKIHPIALEPIPPADLPALVRFSEKLSQIIY